MIWLIDWWMDGLMDGWIDWWMDGWMDRLMDWWMDGWMDGLIDWLIPIGSMNGIFTYMNGLFFFMVDKCRCPSNRPMDPSWDWLIDWSDTPLKFNMEPKNHPIEKENHLPNHPFSGSMLIFQGCNPPSKDFLSLQFLSCHWRSRWISWSERCGHTRRELGSRWPMGRSWHDSQCTQGMCARLWTHGS